MNKPSGHRKSILSCMVWGGLVLFFLLRSGSIMADPPNLSMASERILNQVERLLEKNQTGKALEALQSIKGAESGHYLVQFTLGNCYMGAERYKEAREAYLKAVKAHEGYGPAWYNLANSYMELNQLALAGEAFDKAYDRYDPKRADILFYAASVYLAADQPQKALSEFNRLRALHPEDIKLEWQEVYARILLANKKPMEALPVIELLAAQLRGDRQKEWQEFLLYQYLSLNMEKKALSYARELTHKEPLEPRWWKAVTQIALAQDQYKEALVALTVCGHLAPLSLEEKKLMADLGLMLDIPGQSIAVLEDILADTYDPALVEKIVYGYTAQHKPEAALKWIEKGLAADKANVKLLLLKGEVLFQQQAYADAQQVFQTIVNQDKTEGKAWLMLGYAAWYGEDIPAAIAAMKEAIKFPQYHKTAGEALNGLMRLQREKS